MEIFNAFFNFIISLLNLADEDGAAPRIFSLFQRRVNGLVGLLGNLGLEL